MSKDAKTMKMRDRDSWLFVAMTLFAVLPACRSDDGSTSHPTETTTKPENVATGPSGGFGVPLAANKCPSAAPGSTTTVKEIGDGVEVTVTAPSGTPINDIRQRGVQLIAAAKDPAAGTDKDGLASCPIILKDMIVTETDVPGGATFTVKPSKPANLESLKKETKARAASYVAPK